jgi:hypothetical protein
MFNLVVSPLAAIWLNHALEVKVQSLAIAAAKLNVH